MFEFDPFSPIKLKTDVKKGAASENDFHAIYVGASRKSASAARGRLCVFAPRAQKWRSPKNVLPYAFGDQLVLQVMRHHPETQYSAHFIRPRNTAIQTVGREDSSHHFVLTQKTIGSGRNNETSYKAAQSPEYIVSVRWKVFAICIWHS